MQSETIDVHEELAQARIGPAHWRLGAALALVTLFDGYDVFNPAYVIHYVLQPWHLNHAQAGFLVSSGLIGFLVGSAVHGLIADRFGRRRTLLAALWVASVFTLGTAIWATSFTTFCALRVMTGLGLGVLLPLGTTYINEFAPRRIANTYAIWVVGFGWSLGGALAGVIGLLATPALGWRSLYWTGCGSFLLIPLAQGALPESVKYLALRARTEEIRSILTRLRPEFANRYRELPFAPSAGAATTTANPLRILVSARYVRTTFSIWTAALLSLFCIYSLSGWIPTVMQERGESFTASFGFGALLLIALFFGGLTCGYLADRYSSRQAMMAAWWILGAASVLGMAFTNRHFSNLLLVGSAGFFFGAQFVLNNFTANAYETNVRATAVGMELGIGRIGAILGPWVTGALQQVSNGPTPMFLAISAAGIGAAGFILLARETYSANAGGGVARSFATDHAP